ncbi:MAG: hypothetical protein J6033_08070, partial [Lachnospiraceae bacterium]|nr:hypothetical protein [Lachnospiraceae bacterium]
MKTKAKKSTDLENFTKVKVINGLYIRVIVPVVIVAAIMAVTTVISAISMDRINKNIKNLQEVSSEM